MENYTVESFMTLLSVNLKRNYTDEQLDFAKDFTKPKICFADPGTGKTETSVAGLLTAELHHKVPGENIYALSFTKQATAELQVRHKKACKKLGITQHVNFQTLHKLCTDILKENYLLLGMESLKTTGSMPVEEAASMLLESATELDIKLSPYKARPVVKAIRSMNSSLIFDPKHVESKMAFKEAGVSFKDFTTLRKIMYDFNKCMEIIRVDDILLYTLELMTRHPEVAEKFREKCKIMLVDESQDLSLLQLRVISLLTGNAILVGDIKQQIYAFNGACQEIVAQYFKYYPEAERKYLTQSFRCKTKIADYATSLILANDVGGENFKGVSEGGVITVKPNFDVSSLCESISSDFVNNNHTFPQSILFLFRNNYSVIPLTEELYKNRVPFRVNKYNGAHTIPVIKELCELVELAINPTTLSNASALKYLIPEMKGYRSYADMPIVKVAQKEGCSIFDVNYNFKNEFIGNSAMELLIEVSEANRAGEKAGQLFRRLWPMFYENYMKAKEMYMENNARYYTSLVEPLVKNKTFRQFGKDELDKIEFIKDSEDRRLGVRCYTMHAAKGLEADVVHIVEADAGTIPNKSKMEDMLANHCEIDIAREIRNERSLMYVAVTRAKEELHIHFNAETGLTSMLTSVNLFSEYDNLYKGYKEEYMDVESFKGFFERVA